LAGDVCGIFRIHAFLEHWGIINFNVDPYLKPHKATLAKVEGIDAESILNMEEGKKETGELNAIVSKSSKHPNCSHCGETCNFIWFKHKVSASTLCESCFDGSKQEGNISIKDFEVCSIEAPNIENASSEWTQEELLTLLNCIEKHKDEWDETVEEMNSLGYKRSKEDCIAKFLGLPISESQSSKTSTAISETSHKRPGDNCFYDASNPIFIQIGLFAKELERHTNEEAKKAYSLRKQGVEGEHETLNEYHMLSKEVVEKIKNKTMRRAKKLARKEMKEIRRLVGLVLEAQMKKVECKMDFFNEFDSLLHNEKQQIKALQAQVFAERLNLSMAKTEFLLQGRRRSFDNSRKESVISERKASALSAQLEAKHT
jgi:SWI/SNF related-matrix-associated actin-dependent regulator of chromatin subfamily C